MKKIFILAAFAVSLVASNAQVRYETFDLFTLTNVPTATSHTATNANTNFSSEAISPLGKDCTVWIKFRGTNATTSGTLAFSLFGAPDLTNYAPTALATLTGTYNGTNPVVARFFLPATNFHGCGKIKFGALTNISTNFGVVSWIKVARSLD